MAQTRDTRSFTLKHNETFALFDSAGDMLGRTEKNDDIADGVISNDTRLVSRYVLTIGGKEPILIRSDVDKLNVSFEAELVNPELPGIPEASIHLKRQKVLWNGNIFEKLTITNQANKALILPVAVEFDVDFADIFELRGLSRAQRGAEDPALLGGQTIDRTYQGLDGVKRGANFSFSHLPVQTTGEKAEFSFRLPSGGQKTLISRAGEATKYAMPPTPADFDKAESDARDFIQRQLERNPTISSSNAAFDQWMAQNNADLALLTSELDTGPYPYAGLPWYSTPFGRDGIITALETLWQNPEIARGVLAFQAKNQATATDTFRDSEPGKIFHEVRYGETANTGEVPFGPYYGTIDATPLFVFLAGSYYERTGDIDFIKSIWPNIEKALEWIDKYGDRDGDNFIEYQRGADTGIANQGWKDSFDSVSHANGDLAQGAIALSEVQGYVYAAKQKAAVMAHAMGHAHKATVLQKQAFALKGAFNQAMWSDTLGTYALALDGNKKPCEVLSSNPGHLLLTDIVPENRAQKVIDKLMGPELFSGWGVRTLGQGEKRYEPSKPPHGYHNGTIWTHDTAMAAAGMARFGRTKDSLKCLTALFQAATHFPQMRLPELFGGEPRGPAGTAPVPYPVACKPQAWASGAGALLLQAALGLEINAPAQSITVRNPVLPDWLDWVEVKQLEIAGKNIDLAFKKSPSGVDVTMDDPSQTIRLVRGDDHGPSSAPAPEGMQPG